MDVLFSWAGLDLAGFDLDSHKIKRFAREKGFGLKKLLKIARVSPTAYYSLVRKESLLPKTKAEILSKHEIKFLKALRDGHVDFIVIGLAAAALQGAPIVTQDVDLWFKDLSDPNIQKALQKVGGIYVPPVMTHSPMFAGEAVKLFDIVLNVHGLKKFTEEKKNTILITLGKVQIPVLKLERIIASKKAANRQKDKLVLPILKDVLQTIKHKKKGKVPRVV